MAGDWIKMRADLPNHPKVFALADAFGQDELWVIGALFAFWSWADKHCVDGRVDGATSRLVDRATRVEGLAAALVSVGWLLVDDKGIVIPGYGEHNGDTAKERSLKNQRQARWRERKAAGAVDDSASTPPSTEASTREEKRREEKEQEQSTLPKPKKEKKQKAPETTLTDWSIALAGADPISTDDPIFTWAETSGIPADWIAVAWVMFEDKYGESDKTYADWRAAFRQHVRADWLRAWRFDTRENKFVLTTAGELARRSMA